MDDPRLISTLVGKGQCGYTMCQPNNLKFKIKKREKNWFILISQSIARWCKRRAMRQAALR